MKSFEVKALGLEELSFSERKQTNGGTNIVGWMVAAVLAELFIHSLSDEAYESYKDGFEKGKNSVPGSNFEE